MADDTYPEELYIVEIEFYDYDDAYFWGEFDLPESGEWDSEFFVTDDDSGDYSDEQDAEYWGDDDRDY